MTTEYQNYDHATIEAKWQASWDANKTFEAENVSSKPKFYILDMFPYPSGAGLHAGHAENFTGSDVLGRYKLATGHNVLHPMGWDAFGLPAEQYALKTGTHPSITTEENTNNFRRQIKALGYAIDWTREINTTDPGYYRWTQWIFVQLFKHGLAYVDERPVNWCPALGTVLANEEVIESKSEVGGHPVERKALRQWVLRITAYAEKLLAGLDELDWPTSTKTQQTNWIGRSTGAEIDFALEGRDEKLRVYTTRPDTLFGVTYMVIAPEHALVESLTTEEQKAAVDAYVQAAALKSDLDRTELAKEKTGVFSGSYAIHPITGERVPVWIADYVLTSYGTGAIMAVPGQDERDWEFAETFDLPIKRTVQPPEDFDGKAYTGEGPAINSDFLDGLQIPDAKAKMIAYLEEKKAGVAKTNYKLRDWLFSRQRYWGEPFPIVWVDQAGYEKAKAGGGELAEFLPPEPVTYTDDGTVLYALPVPPSQLPVALPPSENFKPSGDGQSPLANLTEWVNIHINTVTGEISSEPACEDCVPAKRETNTMPQWAGSCWYYLRYLDPKNPDAVIDPEIRDYWGVPDFYMGGREHAVLHLLYARFWHQFLVDIGVLKEAEPFSKLFHQGIILGELEFTLFIDGDGKEVSFSEVSDPDKWEGEKRKLTVNDVEKKKDLFFLKSKPDIQIEAMAHKMSKSRGNVANPDDYIKSHGADAFRTYLMFMGPLEDAKPWKTEGIEGPFRFLKKVWREFTGETPGVSPKIHDNGEETAETLKQLHLTIKKVTEDIEAIRYNTAISALMVCVNHLGKTETIHQSTASAFVQLLAPFAPHLAEELWARLGNEGSVALASWPKYDEAFLVTDEVNIGVLINGKARGQLTLSKTTTQDEALALAKEQPKVAAHLDGKTIRKVIYVPGKILNLVAN